jgi:hypothetical protein
MLYRTIWLFFWTLSIVVYVEVLQRPQHFGDRSSGCIDPYFFDLSTNWRWVVSFTPRLLYPLRKEPPGTHWIGGWVDSRANLNDVEKRKFLTLLGLELWPLSHRAHSQLLYLLHHPSYLQCHVVQWKSTHMSGNCLRLQGWRVSQGRNQYETGNKQSHCCLLYAGFLLVLLFIKMEER